MVAKKVVCGNFTKIYPQSSPFIMNKLISVILFLFPALLARPVFSQEVSSGKLPFENSTLEENKNFTVMPYNRLIQSAGKVITYGDSTLENHALDLCVLPDKKNIVVEDRYGIAIVNDKTKTIISKWTFETDNRWPYLMSTYSGITSFEYKNKIFITWGAAGNGNEAAVMIAEWNGKTIENVTAIDFQIKPPAGNALPNQVIANSENESMFLYTVLNGNNEVVKINFDTKEIVYAAPTGVAPYGLCIIKNKAYVTNWAGPLVTDTSLENAGTPWGSAYTNPVTGATREGSLSIIDITNGKQENELQLGLHPTSLIKSNDDKFLYITNGNSDMVSIVDVNAERVIDSIPTGLFSNQYHYYGSSPDALLLDSSTNTLFVANGMDNAIAVIKLNDRSSGSHDSDVIQGYIPTEAYPSGIALLNHTLYVTNLEAKGSRILNNVLQSNTTPAVPSQAYTIHRELASLSIIPVPKQRKLDSYTESVKTMNLFNRTVASLGSPRPNVTPKPLPDRIGEPSVFKHVIYIIKENKTYDQVYGDIAQGNGDKNLCIYGDSVTPNQHKLSKDFLLMDNYYASGKSSAEGHQWTDAAMVSDYIEKNVRAWFRSYPHRQDDALVYNKNGFIWNDAMDHGKKVRIYGEACLTHYGGMMNWLNIYNKYVNHEPLTLFNTSTIARIRPVISPGYPDCDNFHFTDQIRADVFIDELKNFEKQPGDSLPDLIVLSLPNDHTAGTAQNFPVPEAMVADNDLALGRIIEAITHSRFWDSTVVFVTEDDSQSGWDHVSSYRTTGLVISPYSKMNKTIHTNYNQTSMVRTIEQILGIPPMNVIDATALPMFECFSDSKHSYQYTAVPNKIPLDKMNKSLTQIKGKEKYFAKLSANEAFKELDSGDDDNMNKILWFHAKGNEQYPGSKKNP